METAVSGLEDGDLAGFGIFEILSQIVNHKISLLKWKYRLAL